MSNYRDIQLRTLEPTSINNSILWRIRLTSKLWERLTLSSTEIPKNSRRASVTCMNIDLPFMNYLLAGSADSVLSIYDLDNGSNLIAEIQGAHTGQITDAIWYPVDAGMFTTTSVDGKLKVWDANTLQTASVIHFDIPIFMHALEEDPSHFLIATALDSSHIRLCDLRTGASTHTLIGHRESVRCVSWSPKHSNHLASGGQDGSIRFWDIRRADSCLSTLDINNNKNSAIAHSGAVTGLAFTSDGLHLVSTGMDKRIRLWDAFESKNTNLCTNWEGFQFYKALKPKILSFDQCETPLLLLPNNRKVSCFGLRDMRLVREYKGHLRQVLCLDLCYRRHEMFTGAADREILTWGCST